MHSINTKLKQHEEYCYRKLNSQSKLLTVSHINKKMNKKNILYRQLKSAAWQFILLLALELAKVKHN